MIGQTISHYQILEKLGEGGMGVVFKARDVRLDRFVALKLLPAERVADQSRKKRFVQEAKAASALNHPNIITIYEIATIPGGADLIAMEFIEGQTLRALAKQAIAMELAAEIGRQAAEALVVAHAGGIVHRDIKPENLMLRPDGYVKVLDFGLARLLDDSAVGAVTRSWHTRPGVILGTINYMSPEQARGEAVGNATDIFSLGLVLYELVTGQHPYRSSSTIDTLHAITSEPLLPPSRLQLEIPAYLERLILWMLEKDPSRRPSAAEVVRVLGAVEGRSYGAPPVRAAPTIARRTVGRQKQRAELRSCFESCRAGRGLLVCVSGEPGIGKTTLVDDFLTDVADSQPCVGRGRCSERLAGTEAYLPLLEVLESLIQGPAGPQFARVMKLLAPTWYFQVAPQSDDTATERLRTEAKGASQERMKRELHVFLQEVCGVRPLVLFVDDLHWTDLSTVDVLAYLGDRVSSMRMLILATYRPTDLLLSKHPFLQVKLELQTRGACREIALELLSQEDIRNYLSLSFPEHRFPPEFAAVIHGRTEGNALFMVDLLRYLQDGGTIAQNGTDGGWVLAQPVSEIAGGLPESVRSMIQRKIDRLEETDRRLLVAASVQGYEFDSSVVCKVLAMDPGEVEERLEVLERVHGLVKLLRETELPDQTATLRYQFVHVLYQNALYDSLRPTRRAALSAAVAKALLTHYGEESAAVALQLAFLLEAARDCGRAVDYFLLAAQQASQVCANQEAIALARRGLKLLATLPDTPERAKREISLQIAVGTSIAASRGYAAPEAEEAFSRAGALRLQLGASVELLQAFYGLGAFYFYRSRQQAALEIAEQAVSVAEGFPHPGVQVWSHFMAASVLSHLGDPVAGLKHAGQFLSLYDSRQHSLYVSIGGLDPGLVGGGQSGRLLWLCGYPDRARARVQENLALARKLAHRYSLAFALFFPAWVHRYRREPELCQRCSEEAIAVCSEQGFGSLHAWASALKGWALAEQRQLGEGISYLRESLARLRSFGSELIHTEFLGLLAAALAKGGQLEEAIVTVNEALALCETSDERYYEAELYRLKSELLLLESSANQAGAEALIRQAIGVAQKQNSKCFELRAASSLSRLLHVQGKGEEARQVLSGIYGWFTEGFDTADLREARELLERT